MNTPNKLTILRIIMVPAFMASMLIKSIPHHYLIAVILFTIASLTDMLDGQIARRQNIVTDFGKFLDPLADKLLVTAALICFVEQGLTNSIIVTVIIAREFMVTALRLIAVDGGKVIAASIWGKLKTISQMTAIITIILLQEIKSIDYSILNLIPVDLISNLLMIIAAALTVISGFQYMWDNRKFINTTK